jgi:hypothetical protein
MMAVRLRQAGATIGQFWAKKRDKKTVKKRGNIHHIETKPGLLKNSE